MILIVFAALCLLSVPLTGGHLSRIAHIRLRGGWLAGVAISIQVVITVFWLGGSHWIHSALHIVSYACAGAFLWVNRRIPGALLIGAGAGLNALAIVVNGGVMPASATAERLAHVMLGHGFHNSTPVAHPHLLFLGDIIPFPGPGMLSNVLSVGDIVLYTGMLVLLHRVCRRPVDTPVQDGLVVSAPAVPESAGPDTAATPQSPPRSPRPVHRPTRAGRGVLGPVGIGLAGFVVAVGVSSLVAARER